MDPLKLALLPIPPGGGYWHPCAFESCMWPYVPGTPTRQFDSPRQQIERSGRCGRSLHCSLTGAVLAIFGYRYDPSEADIARHEAGDMVFGAMASYPGNMGFTDNILDLVNKNQETIQKATTPVWTQRPEFEQRHLEVHRR
jgi:hypothetical protein